jgi:hypothetical protein
MIEKDGKYSRNTIIKYTGLLEKNWILIRITDQKEKSYYIDEYLNILYKGIKDKIKILKKLNIS